MLRRWVVWGYFPVGGHRRVPCGTWLFPCLPPPAALAPPLPRRAGFRAPRPMKLGAARCIHAGLLAPPAPCAALPRVQGGLGRARALALCRLSLVRTPALPRWSRCASCWLPFLRPFRLVAPPPATSRFAIVCTNCLGLITVSQLLLQPPPVADGQAVAGQSILRWLPLRRSI